MESTYFYKQQNECYIIFLLLNKFIILYMNSFPLFVHLTNVRVQIQQKRRTNESNTEACTSNFILNQNDFNKQTIDSNQHNNIIPQIGLGLPLFTNKGLWGNNVKGLNWVNQQAKRHSYDLVHLNDLGNGNLFSDLQKMIRKQITLIQPSPAQKHLAQLQLQGKTFYDDRFPPNRQSLCGQSSNPFIWKSIQWRRITDILPNSAIFKDRIQPGDIKQGGLGNCYFLAALAALAQRPDRIFNLFLLKEKNSVRYYSVKILYKGKWIKIDMDQYIPCQGKIPAFSNAVNNQLWVVLLEKAWAKIYMSYKNIQSGYPEESLHDLTGAPIRQIYLKHPSLNKQAQWNYLVSASQREYSMVASSNPGSNANQSSSGIVQGHAYTLLNATVLYYTNGSERIVQLRNPWGKIQYKGRWSDQDPSWQKVHPHQAQRIKFIKNSNDGIFFMPYDSFIDEFSSITVAQINDNASYVYKSIKDRNVEGAFFKISIFQQGHYSLHVDKTPQRSILGNVLGQYRYPQAIIQLGLITGNGCQKIQAYSSLYRTLYRGYYLKPGGYIVYVKISFDKNVERDFDVNLAVYSEYVCDIEVASRNDVVIFTGKPNIKWNPENLEKEEGPWNSLGNTLYQRNNYPDR